LFICIFFKEYILFIFETRANSADAAKLIIAQMGMDSEVAFGKTKIFIKEPQTLVALETAREEMIPRLVARIQVVNRFWSV
jgi:myosin heavy subunit